jgi:CheY-like chemotaxis protein
MADRATILYIEDDPGSQMLVQRTLAFAGYRVVVASRGIEGLDLAAKEMPDLILMDIPNSVQRVPIVALTALSQVGEREKALAAGASGYMTKPVDIDSLPEQVGRYLAGARDTASADALVQAQAAYNQELVSRLEAKLRELSAA